VVVTLPTPPLPPDATPNLLGGTAVPPAATPAPSPPAAAPPAAPPADAPSTSPGIGQAQIILSPPPTMPMSGGPYTVPISVTNASGLSSVALTVNFDATKLRVRSVQPGSFLRTGGVDVVFTQQVNGGRIDVTLVRAGDSTGASGTGLLAAILFEPVAPGPVTLSVSGAATGPGGTAMGLQFRPVTVTVQ
jgi:hypothetical protein